MIAGKLFQRDLGVNLRAGFCRFWRAAVKRSRHLLLAGDQRPQTLFGRREFALHQHKGAVGDAAGVVIRVLLPQADGLQRQQRAVDIVEQQLADLPGGQIAAVLLERRQTSALEAPAGRPSLRDRCRGQ